MSQPLVDPQLAAFWNSDPSRLTPQLGSETTSARRHTLELTIGAAVLVGAQLMRARLAAEHGTVGDAVDVTRRLWRLQAPPWVSQVAPVLLRAWQAEHTLDGISPADALELASDYAGSVADYFGATSADAVGLAVTQQVAAGVEPHLAWQRAALAFGLDERSMRAFVAAASVPPAAGALVSHAAQAFVNRATMARAELLGSSESHTAMEAGKALTWLLLQRLGRLPANAQKEWDSAESESTCAVCVGLDHTRVGLGEMFEVNGQRVFAPQAHPGCKCRINLVVPEALEKADFRPAQHPRGMPGNAGEFRPVTVKTQERDPVVDAIMEQARAQTKEKLAEPEKTESLFEGTKESLFAAPLFTASTLFAPSMKATPLFGESHFAAPGVFKGPELFGSTREAQRAAANRQRRFTRRIVILPPPPQRFPKRRKHFYMAADDVASVRDATLGKQWIHDEDIDFSQLQADADFNLRATSTSAWEALNIRDMFNKRAMGDEHQRLEAVERWTQLAKTAVSIWHQAIMNKDLYLDRLDDADIQEIARRAGMTELDPKTLQPIYVPSVYIKQAIRQEIDKMGTGDNSLALSYADYVAWTKPGIVGESNGAAHIVGEKGAELEAQLDLYREEYGLYLADDPVEQVLAFDPQDVRKQDRRDDHVVPSGMYAPSQIVYRSAIHDFGTPPPLHIGMQVAYLMPFHTGQDGRAQWGD